MALFDDLQREYDKALEGQISKTNGGSLTHFGQAVGGDINVARAVVRNSAVEKGVSLPADDSTDADIAGIVERYFIDKNVHAEGDAMNICYLGYINVIVHNGCERNGKVFVFAKGDKKGQFSGQAVTDGENDTIEMTGAAFTEKHSNGQIGEIHIQTRRGV